MISSLKSKFDSGFRRVVFLSADKISVYHWEKGKLGNSYMFDVSADGQRYFDRYLKETGRITTYFLVDLVEEEYRQDTIPHVFGSDRAAVISRKKTRLFRDTPYFYADVQGREQEGRRDDQVIFMALTNPDLLEPWIKLLTDNKIPLAGIYSVSQITKLLLEHLPEPSDYMLIVSLQSISGLRQTFFYKQKLKISRLVDLPRYGTEPYAPIINEEVNAIYRYLNSLRLLDTDQPLHIYYLADTRLLSEIQGKLSKSFSNKNIFINVNQLGQKLDLKREITTPFSDQLLAHCLLKNRPGNYYALKNETRYYQMQKASRAMYATSLVLVFTGLIWSSLNFINAAILKQQAEIAYKKTEFYADRYKVAREKIPQTPVSPADLEIAVKMSNTISNFKTDPFKMLTVISEGLDQYPLIRLDEISWVAAADPNKKISGDTDTARGTTQGVVGYSNIGTKDTGYDYYQIALMNGDISPFDGNYRNALDMINKFAETLRNMDSVFNVSVVSLPLDTSSQGNLQGASNAGPGTAKFSVRIVIGLSHES